ncbi:hypothetical protein EVAR_2228_1 [Eumeta japonica]|uniref:Uncharacterized protein n=1 Tax=Eumeta variegata TaxID=151549 RepID=A0A4C1SIE6_EUMVA|nr:hypothetical protein EVAR_2228_1 [Eumeta japonica]
MIFYYGRRVSTNGSHAHVTRDRQTTRSVVKSVKPTIQTQGPANYFTARVQLAVGVTPARAHPSRPRCNSIAAGPIGTVAAVDAMRPFRRYTFFWGGDGLEVKSVAFRREGVRSILITGLSIEVVFESNQTL